MKTNRNYSNEPTVGINFFESIPPVGLENGLAYEELVTLIAPKN
jgi:hypothetical protein